MPVRWMSVILLAAGCYAPDVASGVACSDDGTCPDGQQCNLNTGRCEGSVDASTDGGADPDGGGPDGSVCDPTETSINGACAVPITMEVPPADISVTGCATPAANSSRSVAIDRGNRIYAAYVCGGEAFVAVSHDGGATVAAPTSITATGVAGLAVEGGPRKVGYVATGGSAGVGFAVTHDGGANWTGQVLVATAPDSGFGVSVAAVGDAVYVAAKLGGTVRVWRNAAQGVGAFASTDVTIGSVYGGMVADPTSGDVWVTGDTPSLHVRRSRDGGATFEAVIDPPGSYNYSDWSLGGGVIAATGSSQNTFTLISTADPTIANTVAATLPGATTRGRVIAAAADQAIYVATEAGGGALTVTRFEPGATTGTTRMAGNGSGFVVIAGPGTVAPVVLTTGNKVQLGVYRF